MSKGLKSSCSHKDTPGQNNPKLVSQKEYNGTIPLTDCQYKGSGDTGEIFYHQAKCNASSWERR